MNTGPLRIESVESQPFAENTYLLYTEASSDCVVVDPGFEPAKVRAALRQIGRDPTAIWITHGHSDHIAGIGALLEEFPGLPVVIGAGDADKLTDPEKNLSAPFGLSLICPPASHLVHEGDQLELGGCTFQVLETPGHSIGHVVFSWQGEPQGIVIGGDVLFQGSIGRTDFPDGSFPQLRASIHDKLFRLPDTTLVLPGHGPPTTIGEEKRSNPYVGLPSG